MPRVPFNVNKAVESFGILAALSVRGADSVTLTSDSLIADALVGAECDK